MELKASGWEREVQTIDYFFAVFCSRVSVIQYKDRADKDRLYL